MLYDNALIPVVYSEAYQITKDPFYLDVVKKTLNYVLREMTSNEGGFYSAQDADSEGVEGKYYVWKKNEIQEILGDDSEIFCLFIMMLLMEETLKEIQSWQIISISHLFHSNLTKLKMKSLNF